VFSNFTRKLIIMNTKLTLNIDQNVIEEAKFYAKNNSISLSKLIENYLLSLTKKESNTTKISPLVESLTGVISLESTDYKKDYLKK
jgi:hypothetical protein